MNDKNFIEELRQKREEYGVTQTRLAVACGISREYYNRIEKGKQPLNDELREIIEKQIERFNPQEPLFLLIDYFRVRFPTTDALAIIRDVLQLKADYMLYEDYGKYGYESKYILGDINIMCSMQEHLGVLLELKGRGCRQMESYLLAQERSWYDFILDCMTAGGVMKRLALASLPPSHEVMKDKPRKASDFIINKSIGFGILFCGIVFFLVMFALLVYCERRGKGGVDVHELTMFFTTFVMIQFWNLFNAKALMSHHTAFRHFLDTIIQRKRLN